MLVYRDRDSPDGYQLFAVPWSGATGEPIAGSTSDTSWSPILSNPDLTKCPNSCFRPVGLAWDSKGRLFMTSDTTGEIFVITATDGGSADAYQVVGNSPNGGSTSTNTTTKGSATQSFGTAGYGRAVMAMLLAVVFAAALS